MVTILVVRLQKLCISPLTWNVFFISQLGSVLTSFVIILVGNLAVNVTAQVCAIVWQPHVKIENGALLGLEISKHRKNQATDAHLDSKK